MAHFNYLRIFSINTLPMKPVPPVMKMCRPRSISTTRFVSVSSMAFAVLLCKHECGYSTIRYNNILAVSFIVANALSTNTYTHTHIGSRQHVPCGFHVWKTLTQGYPNQRKSTTRNGAHTNLDCTDSVCSKSTRHGNVLPIVRGTVLPVCRYL